MHDLKTQYWDIGEICHLVGHTEDLMDCIRDHVVREVQIHERRQAEAQEKDRPVKVKPVKITKSSVREQDN